MSARAQQADVPQTLIEKIVQRYAVDLRPGVTVQAGDSVNIRPNVVMTHDNTGPVISKYVPASLRSCAPVFPLQNADAVRLHCGYGD